MQRVFRFVTDSAIASTLKSVAGGMDVCCIVRKSAGNAHYNRAVANGASTAKRFNPRLRFMVLLCRTQCFVCRKTRIEPLTTHASIRWITESAKNQTQDFCCDVGVSQSSRHRRQQRKPCEKLEAIRQPKWRNGKRRLSFKSLSAARSSNE